MSFTHWLLTIALMYAAAVQQVPAQTATLKSLQVAADGGSAEAQFNLGSAFYLGTNGAKKDFEESAKWFRLAAAQGHAAAAYCLGAQYGHGEGMPQNYAEAAKWYSAAANLGDGPARFALGELYAEGHGVTKSASEAVRWYTLAAGQGHAEAEFRLGLAYSTGDGITKSFADALKWFRFAALQGNWGAQINLALLYSSGLGTKHDYVLAHMWFDIAADTSTGTDRDSAVKARTSLEKTMTADQIAEAKAKAATCQSSAFKNCAE